MMPLISTTVVVLKIYFTKVKSLERLLELLNFELNMLPINCSSFNFFINANSNFVCLP